MRADEPMKSYANIKVEGVAVPRWLADYINQLRYDRAMRGAKLFMQLYEDTSSPIDWHCSPMKDDGDFLNQCLRIAKAYKARAKRIKEGK